MTENVKNWIEAAIECQSDPSKAQVLPIVQIADDYFFVDIRMNSLRNIDTLDIRKFDSCNDLIRHVLKDAIFIA